MEALWQTAGPMRCALAFGLALALALGCGPDERPAPMRLEVVQRLLDSGAASTVRILHETRRVLASHPSATLVDRRALRTGPQGQVSLTIELGERLPEASRLLLVPTLGLPGRGWRAGAVSLAPVEQSAGRRVVSWQALLPGAANRDVPLFLDAYQPPEDRQTRFETERLRIPERAVLQLSFGVLEAAAGQGPVRFGVQACGGAGCVALFEETLDPAETVGWQERRLSLSELAGQRRTLVFETEHLGGPGPSLPVFASPTLLAARPAAEPRPNVLLISLDTLRADHLSAYGYARDTSPFLARFAAERATLFEDCSAAATHTGPSHMTLLTSTPPSLHGARKGFEAALPLPTLAESLHGAGYATAAFTENGPLAFARGFGRGFDSFFENKDGLVAGDFETILARGRSWLDAHGDRPFFLFLHTYQTHKPYTPPERYEAFFAEESAGSPEAPGSDVRAKALAYDREIRYVDDLLRGFFAWLEERGLLESTVLVVTSDHGEAFLEHGTQGHRSLPYEEIARIPLLLAGPGIPAGRRVAAQAAHVDLMPTLLELTGTPVPASTWGRSLVPWLAAEMPSGSDPAPVFTEAWSLKRGFQPPALSVRVGALKLVRYRKLGRLHQEVYDLERDPDEQTPVVSEPTRQRLAALLDAHEERMQRSRREFGAGEAPGAEPPGVLDPAREEMMRALGYIE